MRKPSSAARAKKQTGTPEKQSTKLVVRNVAFEATRKEVMSLFSPFWPHEELPPAKKV